jgi:hypothetical protein
LREAVGLAVDDEVDPALAIEDHVLGAVLRDRREAHLLEERAQLLGIGSGVLHELETVGAHGVFGCGGAHGLPCRGAGL